MGVLMVKMVKAMLRFSHSQMLDSRFKIGDFGTQWSALYRDRRMSQDSRLTLVLVYPCPGIHIPSYRKRLPIESNHFNACVLTSIVQYLSRRNDQNFHWKNDRFIFKLQYHMFTVVSENNIRGLWKLIWKLTDMSFLVCCQEQYSNSVHSMP